ncbi:hypothetical protein [Thalassospira alkalitolerans]|uniref:hypothetical protein n=1 Tax=Thalassospira alkalitolerans TaxID=1293890 RepID=UPI0030EB1EFD|tara:strand:- start:26223 stop:26774 length:552 start_codon:yes stop_codon:yes gene_type:complete
MSWVQKLKWWFIGLLHEWTGQRLRSKFQRDYFPEHWERHERDEALLIKAEINEVWERETPAVESGWDSIRSWTLRGLTGGLTASLALTVSQNFDKALKPSIYLLVCWFLAGIASIAIRQLLVVQHFREQRKGYVRAVPDGEGFGPAPIWLISARWFDLIALGILVFAVWRGLSLLHTLTQSQS